MQLNIKNLDKIKDKYKDFSDIFYSIENENKRYFLYNELKKLKNALVKKQDYENAAYVRDLEYQIFKSFFDNNTSMNILTNKINLVMMDFSDNSQLQVYCDLIEEDINTIKELNPNIKSLIFSIQTGQLVLSSNGDFTIHEALNVVKLTELTLKPNE